MTHEAAPTVASTSAPSTTSPHAPAGSLETQGSAGRRYLANAAALVDQLLERTWPSIVDAADVITAALHAGRSLHAFGTGHSHMLAEELYYRAGGLVAVRPILFDGLMLHTGARRSTDLERLPGLAAVLLDDHGMAPGDVLIVASNSGGNAVSTELASLARERGATVIAVSSLAHARSAIGKQSFLDRSVRKHQRACTRHDLDTADAKRRCVCGLRIYKSVSARLNIATRIALGRKPVSR